LHTRPADVLAIGLYLARATALGRAVCAIGGHEASALMMDLLKGLLMGPLRQGSAGSRLRNAALAAGLAQAA
jgi:hypothetical protein